MQVLKKCRQSQETPAWLSRESLLGLTTNRLLFLLLLVGVTWGVNQIITYLYRNRHYKITFSERKKDI